MQNIENIILESAKNGTETGLDLSSRPVRQPVYHFALRQGEVMLEFHLEQLFRKRRLAFHYFQVFDDLVTICQRFPIAAVMLGTREESYVEIDLVRSVKANAFLSMIPVVLFHPDPPANLVLAAYESGVDDFVHGDWMDKLMEVRIKRVIERSKRDQSINPSTYLPGPAIIEKEIQRQLDMGSEFAVCYADLDNFKAYNDYYGYMYGDKVIKLTGRIMRDVVFESCREGFVGHIAGDDFIFVVPRDLVEQTCTWVIKTFDAIIPIRYAPEDLKRGFIYTANRRDQLEKFPILSISIAVVINENRQFSRMAEMSKMLADLKKATKQLDGSNYMVERRVKY